MTPQEAIDLVDSALGGGGMRHAKGDEAVTTLRYVLEALGDLYGWAEWAKQRRGSPSMNEPNTGALDKAYRALYGKVPHEKVC